MALLSLVAKLGLDKTGFDVGLTAANKQVGAFGSDLKGKIAGAFSVAAIGAYLKSVSDAVGRIKDLSEQSGLATAEVQKTDYALKQSGLAFEDLAGAMSHLALARREAVEGNEDLRRTFQRYGLGLAELNNPQVRTFDLLIKISEALSRGNVSAREQTEIMDLLGTKARRLANVLSELATSKIPALISDDDIQKLDQFTKGFERLKLRAFAETARSIGPRVGLLNEAGDKFAQGGVGGVLGGVWKTIQALTANAPGQLAEGFRNVTSAFGIKTARPKAAAAANPKAGADGLGLFDLIRMATPDGLFQIDKNKKHGAMSGVGSGSALPDSDQFQRIGAFTGGTGASNQVQLLREANQKLGELLKLHESRGILVRGTD